MIWGETRPAIKFWDMFFQSWTYNNFKWLSKYPTLLGDASATVIDVPLENVIHLRSVWTAWFQFWRKQHHLRIDVLFFCSILNEQRIQWVQLDKLKKKHENAMTPTYIFIASCAPLIRLPDAHLKFECNVLHSNVDFFKNSTHSKFDFFFDSPSTHTHYVNKNIYFDRCIIYLSIYRGRIKFRKWIGI